MGARTARRDGGADRDGRATGVGDGVGVAVAFGVAVGFGSVTVNDRIACVAGRHRAPAHASALSRCDPLPFGVGAEGTLRIERHVFGSIGSFPPIALPSQKNCAVVKLQAVSPVEYVAVKPALARPLPGLTLRVGVGWTMYVTRASEAAGHCRLRLPSM